MRRRVGSDSAEKTASREFSSAHATVSPPGFVRISSPIWRAGDESLLPCPPAQPISSTLPAAPSWLSVPPTKPKRNGFTPSFCSNASPSLSAFRTMLR